MALAHKEEKGRGEEVTCKQKSSYCCSLVRCTETRQDTNIQKEGTIARKVRLRFSKAPDKGRLYEYPGPTNATTQSSASYRSLYQGFSFRR